MNQIGILWDTFWESESFVFLFWVLAIPILIICLVWLFYFIFAPYPLTEDSGLMSEDEIRKRRLRPRVTMLADLFEELLETLYKPFAFLVLLGTPLLVVFLLVKLIKWIWYL